jgi:hypothetical protein
MVLAIPKAILHSRAFHEFTEGLREGHEEELTAWEKLVRQWEEDHDKPCPYEYPEDDGEFSCSHIIMCVLTRVSGRFNDGPVAIAHCRGGARTGRTGDLEDKQAGRIYHRWNGNRGATVRNHYLAEIFTEA